MKKEKEVHDNEISQLRLQAEGLKKNVKRKEEENTNLVNSLRELWENCFSIASRCCVRLRELFFSIGTTLGETSYAARDVAGALQWIEEVDSFEEVMSTQGESRVFVYQDYWKTQLWHNNT
jgi:hypothetical protein